MRFHIQQDSEIPASSQLYNQICFAIAARHYPPGHRLPSTRQLAMQTGLHRNTISKVYRQLEKDGVVEAIAGSGIYVRDQQKQKDLRSASHSIRKKGITKLTKPIKANQYQSFENASIFIFLKKLKIAIKIAPKKILKNAIVSGPKEYVAILILKKAEAQIRDNIDNKI